MRRKYFSINSIVNHCGLLLVDTTINKARLLEDSDLPALPIEAITSKPANHRLQLTDFENPIPIPSGTLAMEVHARTADAFLQFGGPAVTAAGLTDSTEVINGDAPEFIPAKGFLVFDLRHDIHTHFALAGSGAIYVRMWATETGD